MGIKLNDGHDLKIFYMVVVGPFSSEAWPGVTSGAAARSFCRVLVFDLAYYFFRDLFVNRNESMT